MTLKTTMPITPTLKNLGVFLCLAICLAFKNSYGVGPIVLALTAIFTLRSWSGELVWRRELSTLLVFFGLFFALILISALRGGVYKPQIDTATRYLLGILILLFLVKNPPSFKTILYGSLLGGFTLILGALYFYHAHSLADRLSLPRVNPISYGNAAALIFAVLACLLIYTLNTKKYLLSFLLTLSALISLVCIVLTQTRGSLVALAFNAVAISLYLLIYHRPKSKKVWGLILAALLIIGIGAAAIAPHTHIEKRYAVAVSEYDHAHQDLTSSVGARLVLWKYGFHTFAQHPIVGVGRLALHRDLRGWLETQNYPASSIDYLAHYGHLHNQFIDTAASQGIIGLAVLVGLLAFLFVYYWRFPLRPDHHEPDTLIHEEKWRLVCIKLIGISVIASSIGASLTQVTFCLHNLASITFIMYNLIPFTFLYAIQTQRLKDKRLPSSAS